jgi:hypothetical protein
MIHTNGPGLMGVRKDPALVRCGMDGARDREEPPGLIAPRSGVEEEVEYIAGDREVDDDGEEEVTALD